MEINLKNYKQVISIKGINIIELSYFEKLDPDFMEKFINKLNWYYIFRYNDHLSYETIKRFSYIEEFPLILINRKIDLSEEFILDNIRIMEDAYKKFVRTYDSEFILSIPDSYVKIIRQLREGEYKCPKCSRRIHTYSCRKCGGIGKVNWIKNIII